MEPLALEHNLYMYRDPAFPLGADAVALAHFAAAVTRPGDRVLDAGCGAGGVMLLLAGSVPGAVYTGVDIRPDAVELARRAAREQKLPMTAICADLRALPAEFPAEFDVIVANPPYFPLTRGKLPADEGARIARTEVCLTLAGLVGTVSRRLRRHGSFCAVVPPGRLPELLTLCQSAHLEPRELVPVCPCANADAAFVLLRAVKDAKAGAFEIRTPWYLQ